MLRVAKGKFTAILYDHLFEAGSHECALSDNSDIKNSVMNRHHYEGENAQSWFGAPSQKEFEHRLKFGWSEGVDMIQKIATKEIHPASLKRRKIRDLQGDELDIHAVNRGDFSRAWTRTKRQNVNGARNKNITLFCNLVCQHKLDSKQLFFRGASVLKLTEALTEVGYNVAIYGADGGVECSEKRDFGIAQFVEIKSLDTPLDISNLASVIAMPAYKRIYFHAGIVDECDRRKKASRVTLAQIDSSVIEYGIKSLGCFSDSYFIQPMIDDQKSAEAWIDEVMTVIEGG